MNDSFDRNIVIIIFLFSFSYLNFLFIRIRSRTGWSNVTCNPVNLFTNSIFQTQEEANKDFEKCIVSLSAATTKNLFKQQRDEQKEVLTNLSAIEKDYEDLSKSVEKYTKDLSGVEKEYNEEMTKVKDKQKESNELNKSTTSNIDNYLSRIQGIFTNINSYMKNK